MGKRRRMKACCLQNSVYLSSPPTWGMVGLLHNPTENHWWNKISSSREGKGYCFYEMTTVHLPKVFFAWYSEKPSVLEGLWKPLPDFYELWMRCLLLAQTRTANCRAPGCFQSQHYSNRLFLESSSNSTACSDLSGPLEVTGPARFRG